MARTVPAEPARSPHTARRRFGGLGIGVLVCAALCGCQGEDLADSDATDAPGDPNAGEFVSTAAWTVSQAIAMAETGVGFSYKWGGGCWKAGGAHGACYGSCPNCTHSGSWGADCSGYVAKVWQLPGPSATSTCSHPYSTVNFNKDTSMWRTVSRGQVKRGDAFVYNSGGAGHIFLFDRGDPWGSVVAYEASGCSAGIRHGSRSAGSAYHAIRRAGF